MPLPKDFYKEPNEHVFCKVEDINVKETEFGKRICVEILPLGEAVGREFRFNAENAAGRRSAWQKFLKMWRDIGVSTDDDDSLIGLVVDFRIVDGTFTDRDTGEQRTYDIWKPERVFEDEMEAIIAMDALETEKVNPSDLLAGADVATDTTEATPEAASSIPDEIAAAARAIYEQLNSDDETADITDAKFIAVAKATWDDLDADELLAAAKTE